MRRGGTHRLECGSCEGFVYATIQQLETRGVPACGWCQRPMHPAKVDLALELGVDHPALDAIERDGYNRERSQVRALGGYQRAAHRMASASSGVANMHERALDAHREYERETVRRRLAANFPRPVEAMPF